MLDWTRGQGITDSLRFRVLEWKTHGGGSVNDRDLKIPSLFYWPPRCPLLFPFPGQGIPEAHLLHSMVRRFATLEIPLRRDDAMMRKGTPPRLNGPELFANT
jgi:hypothetical protein